MNAQQLKNAILQEAIEGRLVPQDPNDEPASVLLDKIRKEKARLVKEGKLKKKDLEETPISEDEKPFEIPGSWEWCKLGNILKLKSGDCIKISSLSEDSKYPVYGGNGINGSYDYYNVEAETLIVGRVGFYCGSVHKTNSRAWVTDNALIVTYNKSLFHIDYMKYALIYLNLSSTSNSTAQPVVSGKGIYPLLIPLPPLAEQKRIVAKIEELLPKVEEYGKAQEALDKLNEELPEKLKKSILQEAIEGRLVPQDPNDEPASVLLDKIRAEKKQLVKEGKLKKKDLEETPISEDEKPFEIPESWEWTPLSMLIKMISGTSYSKNDVKKDGVRILRGGNIQNNELFLYDDDVFVPFELYDNEKNIAKYDIVIVASTGSKAVIGKPAFIRKTYENVQIGAFLRIIRPHLDLYASYLEMIFSSEYYRKHIRDKVKGTNINNIKSEYIEDLLIPFPPLAEQKRIVAKIEQLMKEIDKLKV